MDRSVTSNRNPTVSEGANRANIRTRSSLDHWIFSLAAIPISLFLNGCGQRTRHTGIPSDAQAVLDTAIQDIDAGRYEKLYNEAADEWRKDATLEDSKATLQR